MADYEPLNQSEDEAINATPLEVYPTYKRRWFYLFVVCLAEISNALVGHRSTCVLLRIDDVSRRFGSTFLRLPISVPITIVSVTMPLIG